MERGTWHREMGNGAWEMSSDRWSLAFLSMSFPPCFFIYFFCPGHAQSGKRLYFLFRTSPFVFGLLAIEPLLRRIQFRFRIGRLAGPHPPTFLDDDGKLAAISHFYCFRSRPRNYRIQKEYMYICIKKRAGTSRGKRGTENCKESDGKPAGKVEGERPVEIGQPNNLWQQFFLTFFVNPKRGREKKGRTRSEMS